MPFPALALFVWMAIAGRPLGQPAQEPAPAPNVDGLAALAARDARLSFGADSAARARAKLASGPLEVERRATALLALGGSRPGTDLAPIESALADGKPVERRAALFALGELGAAGLPLLEGVADPAGLEDALCVALLVAEKRGAPAARERLSTLAQGSDALAASAAGALEHGLASPEGGELAALSEYYELRWRAAREFGLVDGQRGQKALTSELFADAAFRARVVLLGAGELGAPELEAHLFELLSDGESADVLRLGAVHAPAALARAIEGGKWTPSLDGWRTMLTAIDAERAERRAQALLELGYRANVELEPLAGLLLVRAGGDLSWQWIADQLEKREPSARGRLVEACGDRGDKACIPELAALLERRPELGVAGEGLVALARLGHPPAKTALDELVKGPEKPERDQAVTALARVLHDPNVRPRALEALRRDDLPDEQRLALELGLARNGASTDHAPLRAALAARPRGELRLELVRALAVAPEHDDLEALALFFPVEGDPEWNLALALALLGERHTALDPLLRLALWNDPWNVSLLAGGLLARGGARVLADELEAPPRTACEPDLRRVGFALGEWGGVGAVETLARTRSESDPALQGALFGALFGRAAEPVMVAPFRAPGKVDLTMPGAGPGGGEGKAAGPAGPPAAHPKRHRRRGG